MRALILADLHLHNYQSHSVILQDGRNSRLVDGLNSLEQVHDYARGHGIELIIILGDIFQQRGLVNVGIFNQAHESLSRMSKTSELLLVVGNHDLASMYGNVHSSETFKEFATVADVPQVVRKLGIDFCCVPFSSKAEEVRETIKEMSQRPNPKVLLLHQGIDGAYALGDVVLQESLTKEDLCWWDFDFVFAGHYHMRQWLGYNSLYPGCLYPLTFADANQPRGFLDVNFRNRTAKFVETKAPRFVTIEWSDFKDGHPDVWDKVEGNIVKVFVRDGTNMEEVKQTVGAINPQSLVVEIDRPVSFQKRTELSISMGTDELVEKYVHSAEVDTEMFDDEELVRIGREIVRSAGV